MHHPDKAQSFFLLRTAICLLIVSVCVACASRRPPYKERGIPANIDGSFAFTPAIQLFHQSLRGEIVFDPIPGPVPKTHFRMRIVGLTSSGSVRMRSYDGSAVVLGRFMELRSDRCYLFGKRDWDDRMVPLERWDCDHLIFVLERTGDKTKPFRSMTTPQTTKSDWFGQVVLIPLPLNVEEEAVFAGQVIADLDTDRSVVWGSRADRQLRNGQSLRVEDSGGRYAGTMVVESRPGDFVIGRWTERPGSVGISATGGLVAWTRERIRGTGPFD